MKWSVYQQVNNKWYRISFATTLQQAYKDYYTLQDMVLYPLCINGVSQ